MKVIELPVESLREASWNPNRMGEAMQARLRESLRRFGLVENLVVRTMGSAYEVLGGNQRLHVLKELGRTHVPCVVVSLDDAGARLLAQALNHIEGEDDFATRVELLRKLLKDIPQGDILAILPETSQSLEALSSLGQETLASHLQKWEQAQSARLKHLQFQLTVGQLEIVEKALAQVLPKAKEQGESPNVRGTALHLLCKSYLEHGGGK